MADPCSSPDRHRPDHVAEARGCPDAEDAQVPTATDIEAHIMATPSTRISGGNLSTPIGEAPIVPLVALGIGLYLFWYTVHYWKQGGWPTTRAKWDFHSRGGRGAP